MNIELFYRSRLYNELKQVAAVAVAVAMMEKIIREADNGKESD